MARQSQASEFNSFVGGLVTEANPLTYPPNTALDINNFVINKTGTISRRLGMDFENGYEVIDSGVSAGASGEVAINSFKWENAGGYANLVVVVVQVGSILKFYSTSGSSISGSLLYTYDTEELDQTIVYSGAVVDGVLVIATGSPELLKFEYSSLGVISEGTFRLKIRDVFGVEDIDEETGVDLRAPENISKRPLNLFPPTPEHIYNLRNSTYAIPRLVGGSVGVTEQDPITALYQAIAPRLPSNADSILKALFEDPTAEGSKIYTKNFYTDVVAKSPQGNTESPQGYFIIDALSRGTSRLEQVGKLMDDWYSDLDGFLEILEVTDLPQDRTSGGASVVSEFAGRAWYAGFNGDVIDGDRHSPRLSSFVLYSRLVKSASGLSDCHQINDPTSSEEPDPLDTDGGFIRLDGAYNIQSMINIGQALIVIAENGVWAIMGGSDYGFTALDHKVVKITEHGCTSKGSIVLVDGTVMYWGDDAIYHIKPNEVGGLSESNLTSTTVQSLFEGVETVDKRFVQGQYDSFERKVRWLYGNRIGEEDDTVELVLDLNLSAFYKHTIPGVSTGSPNVVMPIEVPPFKIGQSTDAVYYGSEQVLYGTEEVVDTQNILISGVRETIYLVTTSTFPTVEYTFASYRDGTFTDWVSQDGVGIDSPAYLVTGFNGFGDYQRYKQVPYVTFHFNKTEDGFYTDEEGDIYPTNPSSCLVQAQWEWSNSIESGRWGREFQAYRFKRPYIPESAASDFNNGFSTVVTKNKIRGKGKVLSFLIKTEPQKDCQLLGWSMITNIANNV